MARHRRTKNRSAPRSPPSADGGGAVRIIGGKFRGRRLRYQADPRTRPMKDRVREALFGRLGPDVREKQVLDLFAGTGALGLEAISRGAATATLIEQHFPTARLIEQSAADLGLADRVQVAAGNTFIWVRRQLPASDRPWLVFCSPPYRFYSERADEMRQLIETLYQRALGGSLFVVEADTGFDVGQLPDASLWDARAYPPAVVAIARKPAATKEAV